MTADPRFQDLFRELTGHTPMAWQQRLFDRFMAGEIPGVIDLPTGLGKTAVIVIWLLARAFADEARRAVIPRRLVYVVDRRAVVDQATEVAQKLRQRLKTRAELRQQLGLSDDIKLPISTLRGAHIDNREWLRDPAVPAIIVGTVDMIGSRLLFEGYGVSRGMRPYHAGLLGADALIVLDEAHLIPPFEALMRRITGAESEFGTCAGGGSKIVPPLRLLALSATGRDRLAPALGIEPKAFRLEDGDLSDPVVKQRLTAKKALSLTRIGDGKGALVDALTQRAWLLSQRGIGVRCLIYCDSREIAEKVNEKLARLAAPTREGSEAKADTELLVGARRAKEREDVAIWLQNHGFLAGAEMPNKPAFLISTSAGEVGVDLDADHMVCDLVPWESMVQRLGRVNRLGKGAAEINVLWREPAVKDATAPTAAEQRAKIAANARIVIETLPRDSDVFDTSPGALRDLKLRAETDQTLREVIAAATTPEPLRPALTRALVDAWSMTSLETHPGRPEIAPWLRGWVEDDPQTTVIWRSHMPVREAVPGWPRTSREKAEIEEFFAAAPPLESEKLETETYRVADWLHDRAGELLNRKKTAGNNTVEREDPGASAFAAEERDADGSQPAPVLRATLKPDEVVASILSPGLACERCLTLGELAQERKGTAAKKGFYDLLVGKIVVVDARFGGLASGLLDAANDVPPATADTSAEWSSSARFRVRRTAVGAGDEQEEGWRFEGLFDLRRDEEGNPLERLVVEHFRDAAQKEDARSISRPQTLAEHQNWVELKARHIAGQVGLAGVAADALALAAMLHDEGKKARRWQRAFNAPRDAARHGLAGPLAKTLGPIDQAILDGYRHEFGSLPYAEHSNAVRALPEDWYDLVMHLIAAHHGGARPIISTRGCEDAPPSALEARAREVALRFARLQKRWGPWGLAWWELLMRAADQQASRDNDERKDPATAQREAI